MLNEHIDAFDLVLKFFGELRNPRGIWLAKKVFEKLSWVLALQRLSEGVCGATGSAWTLSATTIACMMEMKLEKLPLNNIYLVHLLQ